MKSKRQDKIKQMPPGKKKQIIIAVCSSLFYFCFYYRIPSRSQGPLQGFLIYNARLLLLTIIERFLIHYVLCSGSSFFPPFVSFFLFLIDEKCYPILYKNQP